MATQGDMCLAGVGIGRERLAATASHLNLSLADERSAGVSPCLMVAAEVTEPLLARSLQVPYCGCIEAVGPPSRPAFPDALPPWLVTGGSGAVGDCDMTGIGDRALWVWISSRTAFYRAPATALANALAARLRLNGDIRDTLEMALGEAIGNAILHGNLGLCSRQRESFSAIEPFIHELDQRLSHAAYGDKPVEVVARWTETSIALQVTDQGNGFHTPVPGQRRASGRGLRIIASLAQHVSWGLGGRRIIMAFARTDPPTSGLDSILEQINLD